MIEVSHLSKRFPTARKAKADRSAAERRANDPRDGEHFFHAVRDVSFTCAPGQVLGVLGLNGAGKTTTLRMLSTALTPTSGSISIDGVDVVANPLAMQKQIGFLSGSTSLYNRLTVRENVAYFGKLHGMKGKALDARIDEVFSLLDVHPFQDKLAGALSTGMKQRANIARAVVHDPRVLVLDEPTTGLDVVSAKAIVDFITSYRSRKVPVLFSTHHLHEVEHLCDKVVFIHQGTSQFEGTLEQFRSQLASRDLYDVFLHLSREAAAPTAVN
jgi:sodium transport system ATP-binding protein